jgi:hypothetical protein
LIILIILGEAYKFEKSWLCDNYHISKIIIFPGDRTFNLLLRTRTGVMN